MVESRSVGGRSNTSSAASIRRSATGASASAVEEVKMTNRAAVEKTFEEL